MCLVRPALRAASHARHARHARHDAGGAWRGNPRVAGRLEFLVQQSRRPFLVARPPRQVSSPPPPLLLFYLLCLALVFIDRPDVALCPTPALSLSTPSLPPHHPDLQKLPGMRWPADASVSSSLCPPPPSALLSLSLSPLCVGRADCPGAISFFCWRWGWQVCWT